MERDFDQIFRLIVSTREKAFKNTNLVASRHIKRENTSHPVDVPNMADVTSREKALHEANSNQISLEELFYYFFSVHYYNRKVSILMQ